MTTQTAITTREELDAHMANGPFFACDLQVRDCGTRYYSATGGLIIVYPDYSTIVHEATQHSGWSKVDRDMPLQAEDYYDWFK